MKSKNSVVHAGSSESTFHSAIQAMANSGGRLTLNEAAQLAGLSAGRFSRAFKKAQGLSFLAARQRAKMEMAASLLSETELPVTWIAEMSGYSELSKFRMAFRRHFGTSPRSFRSGNGGT